jgi:hypothetical protein
LHNQLAAGLAAISTNDKMDQAAKDKAALLLMANYRNGLALISSVGNIDDLSSLVDLSGPTKAAADSAKASSLVSLKAQLQEMDAARARDSSNHDSGSVEWRTREMARLTAEINALNAQ